MSTYLNDDGESSQRLFVPLRGTDVRIFMTCFVLLGQSS